MWFAAPPPPVLVAVSLLPGFRRHPEGVASTWLLLSVGELFRTPLHVSAKNGQGFYYLSMRSPVEESDEF